MKLLLLCSVLSLGFSINAYADNKVSNLFTKSSEKQESKSKEITLKEIKRAKKDAIIFLDEGRESKRLTALFEKFQVDETYSQQSKEEIAALIIMMNL